MSHPDPSLSFVSVSTPADILCNIQRGVARDAREILHPGLGETQVAGTWHSSPPSCDDIAQDSLAPPLRSGVTVVLEFLLVWGGISAMSWFRGGLRNRSRERVR